MVQKRKEKKILNTKGVFSKHVPKSILKLQMYDMEHLIKHKPYMQHLSKSNHICPMHIRGTFLFRFYFHLAMLIGFVPSVRINNQIVLSPFYNFSNI